MLPLEGELAVLLQRFAFAFALVAAEDTRALRAAFFLCSLLPGFHSFSSPLRDELVWKRHSLDPFEVKRKETSPSSGPRLATHSSTPGPTSPGKPADAPACPGYPGSSGSLQTSILNQTSFGCWLNGLFTARAASETSHPLPSFVLAPVWCPGR